jgi:hypothetical protein
VPSSQVLWNGAARTTVFVSSTMLTAAISAPDIALGTVADIRVVTPAPGGGASTALNLLLLNPVPSLSSFNPGSVPLGSGDLTLTVTGSRFLSSSVIQWNGAPRVTTLLGPTQLSALIPASDLAVAGPVSITVFTPAPGGGTSAAATLTILNPLPILGGVDPAVAIVGAAGFTLTVTGSGFEPSSVVRWNGAPRPTTFISGGALSAAIPASDLAATGTASITVVTPAPGGGTSGSLGLAIQNPAPVLGSLDPSAMTAGSGSFTLTVTGTGFVASSVVRWNGVARATTFVDATTLRATILAADVAAVGSAVVTVVTPAPGGGTSAGATLAVTPPPAGPATLVSPAGSITSSTPVFTWRAVSTATQYMLAVDDSSGPRIRESYTAAQAGCPTGTGTCSVTPAVVVTGTGQWQIRAANALGEGAWSAPLTFMVAATAPVYPLKVGPTGRYLVDQNGTPFLIAGDSPQTMMGEVSLADAELYFANRQTLGFNTVWINLLCGAATGCENDATTFDGIAPFTTPEDLATPNETYFLRLDAMLQRAEQHGILVLLDPIETRRWLAVLRANGVDKARAYGLFLGSRYKSFSNIIWMHGNDYGPLNGIPDAADDAVVMAVAQGLKDGGAQQLQTIEFNADAFSTPALSTASPRWAPFVDLNAAHTYRPTHEAVQQGYDRQPAMPVFMVESAYEGELGSTPKSLRAQAYWSNLSGATGQLFGSGDIWKFEPGWQTRLNSVGAAQFSYVTALFAPRRWYDLVPDRGHTFVTDGYGTFGQPDYVTAAQAPDGGLAIAYLPSARTITVNMATMAGSTTARWYDPASGAFVNIPGSPFANAGSRAFTPPGNNADGAGNDDWVLLLEAQATLALTLTSLTPAQANVGGGDFVLTASGTNFDATSVLRVNGAARPTTVSSVTRLVGTIPAADIAVGGTLSVSVFTPGAGTSNTLSLTVRNPVPSLSTISPTRALQGGPDLTLTLTGVNFVAASVVRWKGLDRPTTLVSPTQLTAVIPASDLAATGTALVSVFTPTPAGGTSMAATFTVDAAGRVAFASATTTVNETAPNVTLMVNRTLGVGGPVTVDYATSDGTAHAGVDYEATTGTLTFSALETSKTIVVPITFTKGGTDKTFTVALSNPKPQPGFGVIAPATTTVTVRNVDSTLMSFTPVQGPVGTVVTITGTNLDIATGARFQGGRDSGITLMSPTSVRTTVPAGAVTGPISVLSRAGNPTSTGVFKVTPVITSLMPDDGVVGTLVTIVGSSFTNASAVRFGTIAVPATDFTVVNDTTITATVPSAAVTAAVSVTTPGGSATSPAPFVVIKAPTLTSFTPAVGAEGTIVTLTGTNLASVTSVSFKGASVPRVNASPVTVLSATSLRVTVPAGATTGRLGLVNPAGSVTSSTDFRVAPQIVSITPAQALPGATVTITGTTLTDASSLKFGAVAQPIFTVAANGSAITTTVPTTAVTAKITITTPAATAMSPADFVVIRTPTIASFTPTAGPIGTIVTITGTNLTSVTDVAFNGVNASSVTVLSATSLKVVVPASAASGKLTVFDPAGSATSGGGFSVTPSFDGLLPSRGVPGTLVTITGQAFTSASIVRFGTVMAANLSISGSTQIVAVVPPTATTGPVFITTAAGTATSGETFTVVKTPTITAISPVRGPIGSAVTLTGANLGTVTAVDFNGANVTTITALSPTSVRVVVPTGAQSGKIHAANEAGSATSAVDFVLTPQIVSMSPGRGLPGSTVVLTGSNLTDASAVRFGTVAVARTDFTVNSDTQITTQVPQSAVTSKISVTTPTGTATSSSEFAVIRPLTLTSFTPASGPEGTLVTLTGTNLAAANRVAFGGANVTGITVLSATTARVVVPAGATTSKITVADEVDSAESAASFTVTPRIVTIPTAALPGAGITITGTSLGDASAVRFGGVAATAFTVDGPTQITATVPASAASGKITITTASGTATSPTDFTVIRTPTITSFAPAGGQVGSVVTLTGANLGSVTQVTFGNVSAPITAVSATSVQVTVPAGARTGRLTVVNPAGNAQSATSFTVTPRITGFSAPSGSDDTVVSILGDSFTGVTAVKFGSVSATFTFVSDGEISALVPAAAVTGKISITTPAGTATSPTDFIITAPSPF